MGALRLVQDRGGVEGRGWMEGGGQENQYTGILKFSNKQWDRCTTNGDVCA